MLFWMSLILGLDITSGELIENVIQYVKAYRSTVILITHHEEIAAKTEFSYFMCGGRLFEKDFQKRLLNTTKSPADDVSDDHQDK